MSVPRLRTARLLLREWADDDLAPFATMNADPEVMRYFPAPLRRAESDAMVERIRVGFEQWGFGMWAVEVTDPAYDAADPRFAGFVGLWRPGFDAPFLPAVEIGWRLRREAWGRGYATEGAGAAVAHGFGAAGLAGIVSFTAVRNAPSRAVMRRLGMRHDPAEDFDHPRLPVGHPLRRHVLYRLSRPAAPAI